MACSPDAFDAQGEWRGAPTPPDYSRCPSNVGLHGSDERQRFGCNASFRRWAVPACPPLAVPIASVLGSATVFLVGDSLQFQWYRSVLCRAFSEASPVSSAGAARRRVPTWIRQLPRPTGVVECGPVGAGTACYVDAGTAVTRWRTVATMTRLLIDAGIATARDVIVANEGLHHAAAPQRELGSLAEFAANPLTRRICKVAPPRAPRRAQPPSQAFSPDC